MEAGGTISLERGFDASVVEELAQRGHVIDDRPGGYGGYQAILWDAKNSVYRGASESRKDGHAAGY